MNVHDLKAYNRSSLILVLALWYSMASATVSFANMQNPILSGITKLTLTCEFVGKLTRHQRTHICDTVKAGLQKRFELPVRTSSPSSGLTTSNEFGVLRVSLRVILDSIKITGQLTWSNSVKMKGLSDKINGKTVRKNLSPTSNYDAAEFTTSILDTIRF